MNDGSTSTSAREQRLRPRLERLSGRLRETLSELILTTLEVSDFRPLHLTERLGLDKSVSSRISRALRATDPMATMHEIPTPQGVGLLLDACEAKGATEARLSRARAVLGDYAELLREFSGGRGDLDTALAAWLPDLRARAERKARRDVFRGWSTIMGLRSDTLYIAYAVVPGRTKGRLDTLWMSSRQGLRRLREGERVEIAGLVTLDPETFARRRDLSGAPLTEDPRTLLSSKETTLDERAFQTVRENDRLLLTLAGDEPGVNEPVHVTIGGQTLDHFPTRACDECSYLWLDTASRLPVEQHVIEVFVHRDVEVAGPATVTRVLEGTRSYGETSIPSDLGPQAVRHGIELETMTASGRSAALLGVNRRAELVAELFGSRGFDEGEFTVHRVREDFPAPTYRTAVWLPLPGFDA